MRNLLPRRAALAALVGLVAALAPPRATADVVLPGYDLFQTVQPTNFNGVAFQGVPLGLFNFGGAIGVQNTMNTDTIVQRLATATAPAGGSATIPIQMIALQLMSVVPTNFGLGLDFYFITLQSARGGPASPGTMTINFANPTPGGPPPAQPLAGTFSSAIDVFFDVRKGGLNGPIALSSDLVLTNSQTPWSHFPAPGTTQITGVNAFLNQNDHFNDFFPIGVFTEIHPTGAQHSVVAAPTVPEPSTLVTGTLCALIGVVQVLRNRRKAG